MERLLFDVEGSQLVGERSGTGGPAVVFLHAGVCDRRSWRGVIEHLPGNGTAVSYDRRGYGETPAATAPFSMVDDLRTVLTDAAAGPAWLVGSSMGGGLAVDAALTVPDAVAGLVLLAPAVRGAPDIDELADPHTASVVGPLEAAWTEGRLDEANRLSTWLWLDGPSGPEGRVGGPARQLALEMGAIALTNEDDEYAGSPVDDAWSRLGEITVPVTVACGDRDIPDILDAARTLAGLLPHARFEILADRAHLPYLEDPGAVAALVAAAVGI